MEIYIGDILLFNRPLYESSDPLHIWIARVISRPSFTHRYGRLISIYDNWYIQKWHQMEFQITYSFIEEMGPNGANILSKISEEELTEWLLKLA